MAFGYTRTLPTITGSHTDFPVLLTEGSFPTAAIDGGPSSILNGGGNLRAYTDDTKAAALPLEVVTFVTGVSPQVQVWVKIPTAATGNTIYLEADDVEVSQPAATDPIGRNAVWADFRYVSHDGLIDSTGNSTITQFGSPGAGSNPWGGASVILNGSNQYGRASTDKPIDYLVYISAWVNPVSVSNENAPIGLFTSNSAVLWETLQAFNGNVSLWQRLGSGDAGNIVESTSPFVVNSWQQITGTAGSATDRRAYLNGSNRGQNTNQALPLPPDNLNRITYGRRDDSTPGSYFNGQISEIWVSDTPRSDDFTETKFSNQNSPGSWGASSAWEDQGGGISVTPDSILNLQSVSEPNLTQSHSLLVDNLTNEHQISEPVLTQGYVLNVDGIVNNQTLSNVTLVLAGGLSVQSLSQLNDITEPSLTQKHNLVINNVSSDQDVANIDLIQNYILSVDDVSSLQDLTNIDLVVGNGLVVQSLETGQEITEPNLIQGNVLITNPITQNQFIGNVILNGQEQTIGTVTAAFKESGIDVKYGVAQFTVKFKD